LDFFACLNNYIFLDNFNNMENIVEPNGTFDFSKLSLVHPVGIQGGAYFTKIENSKKPLYIQTTKSQSRQGFVKTGKKYYIDLMFDKNAEELIQWFENLENCCQKLIFEKRDKWFQNGLEESDIETAFNSTIRVYKSGKYYLLRSNVKNNLQNEPSINIYNEQQIPLKMDIINSETNFISILEIQGIKFTSRNFQIEIELKQIMILDNDPIFDNCLIKTNYKSKEQSIQEQSIQEQSIQEQSIQEQSIQEQSIQEQSIQEQSIQDIKIDDLEIDIPLDIPYEENIQNTSKINNLEEIIHLIPSDISIPEEKQEDISLDFEDIEENIEENDVLKEVHNLDVSLEKTLDVMQLKKPNQVYFELYKEARNKAKLAKKNAIVAYLEAKNIKKTYMIENCIDSDSDFDAEIDEVSESELEDL